MEPSEVNNEFNRIIHELTVADSPLEQANEVSLEAIRQLLVEHFVDHLISLDLHDDVVLEDGDRRTIVEVLTSYIHRDFRSVAELDIGDTITARGESIIMLVDEADMGFSVLPITAGVIAMGSLENIIVTEIPHISSLHTLLDETSTQYDDASEPLPMMPLGVAILLEDVMIITPEGTLEYLPDHVAAVLPLHYPTLELRKIET